MISKILGASGGSKISLSNKQSSAARSSSGDISNSFMSGAFYTGGSESNNLIFGAIALVLLFVVLKK